MKFKKVTKAKAVSNSVQLAEGIAGGMASKGLFSLLPVDYQTNLVKGGIALVNMLGAIVVPNKHIKAVLGGMALVQGVEFASTEIKKLDIGGDSQFITASLGKGVNGTPISRDAWSSYRHQQKTTAPQEIFAMQVM